MGSAVICVINTFLHGELDEDIYIEVQLGYKNLGVEMICKLKRPYMYRNSHLRPGLGDIGQLCSKWDTNKVNVIILCL